MKTDAFKKNLEEMKRKKAEAEYCLESLSLAGLEKGAGYFSVCVSPNGGFNEYSFPLATGELKCLLENEIKYRNFYIQNTGPLLRMLEQEENGA